MKRPTAYRVRALTADDMVELPFAASPGSVERTVEGEPLLRSRPIRIGARKTEARKGYVYDYDPRRHGDLLQGLGPGAAGRLQPRLAANGRSLGRPDVLPDLTWVSLHRA